MKMYLVATTPFTSKSTGVIIPTGAVFAVERFHGNLESVNFSINCWISVEAYKANLAPIDSIFLSLPSDTITTPSALFEYFTSIEPFIGAQIVIE